MALTSKKYTRIYSSEGSDSDKIDSDKVAKLESDFNSNSYLKAFGQFDMLAPVLHILQKLTEEIDYLRTEISTNKDKTGITTTQSGMITDNKTEAARLNGLIATNTTNITANTRSIGINNVAAINVGAYPSNTILPPNTCLLYTSPSPRDRTRSRMPSSA